ncbi:attacin-B-like [Vanessa cardui]|uniref:attacin-B-like n=1 Tax=Vanessa cardui TaxID=171605 RepID=UPI001F1316F4|nr:attacin-B-like [Vanessa cardui]
MPLTGNVSENADKTKNFHLSGAKEFDNHTVNANAFVSGQRDVPDPRNLNAPSYKVAGGGLGVEHTAGHSVGVSAQHIPNFGNQVTASSNLNVVRTENHKIDLNAFTTNSMPKAGPNFATHGAGVDYNFKEKLGANASVTHTPMFKQTDYSVGGNVNLYKNPTTSIDFSAGAHRTDTAFGRGNWEKQGMMKFNKQF